VIAPVSTNLVDIAGDSSNLFLRLTNLSGANSLDFIGGSFKGTSEERRVCVIFVGVGNKVIRLRYEFLDPAFPQLSLNGTPLYQSGSETNVGTI